MEAERLSKEQGISTIEEKQGLILISLWFLAYHAVLWFVTVFYSYSPTDDVNPSSESGDASSHEEDSSSSSC